MFLNKGDNMEFVPVKSENIKSYFYDGKNLYIIFQNDAKYVFYLVPKAVMDEFIEAPSKGSYFSKNIKKMYSYQKL